MSTEDSKYRDGEETARGWKAKKYYLSAEAIELLAAHCKGTPLTMSAWIDATIKRELGAPRPYVPGQLAASITPQIFDGYQKLFEESQRQLAELTSAGHDLDLDVVKRVAAAESVGRPPRDPREPLGDFQKMAALPEKQRLAEKQRAETQPTRKDFKVDL